MRTERITLREIRDLLNKVEDVFLDEPLHVWGEERGFTIDDAEILDQNWYLMDGEYLTPESELHSWEAAEGEDPSEKELVYMKGEFIAQIDVPLEARKKQKEFLKELDNE